jgi:hypothetical protein
LCGRKAVWVSRVSIEWVSCCPQNSVAPGTAYSDPARRYHDQRTGNEIQVQSAKSLRREVDVGLSALTRGSQQNYRRMASGRISAEVGETLVGGHQPALLALYARPQDIIGSALPSLLHHCCGVAAARIEQIDDPPR